MTWTLEHQYAVFPHTSPTAVAYRATEEATARWKAEAVFAYLAEREAYQEVADTWREVFAEVVDRPHQVYASRALPSAGEAPRRRHRHHWQLYATAPYDLVLPHCHLIAHPGRCRGHAQAPDLRTRLGRAMQADLDTLADLPTQHLDMLFDLPGDGSASLTDACGRLLGRSTLISTSVAPGCRYVIWEARPEQTLDPSVWTQVPVQEYLAVKDEPLAVVNR